MKLKRTTVTQAMSSEGHITGIPGWAFDWKGIPLVVHKKAQREPDGSIKMLKTWTVTCPRTGLRAMPLCAWFRNKGKNERRNSAVDITIARMNELGYEKVMQIMESCPSLTENE